MSIFGTAYSQQFDLSRLELSGGGCLIGERFSIVTSQPFVSGRNATDVEIGRFMRGAGFTKICDATWYRPVDELAVFDVGGSNLFASETGELIPIDVIPIRPEGDFLERIEEAYRRVAK